MKLLLKQRKGSSQSPWVLMACLAALLCMGATAFGEDEPPLGKSTYAFDQAIQSYLKGDSQSAIQQLDESLRLDPSNSKVKVFLLKVLVERGSRLFLAKQYQKAYDYLSRAYTMDQSNQQVRQMFELAAKQMNPQQGSGQGMLIPQGMQTELLKAQAAEHVRAQNAPEYRAEMSKPGAAGGVVTSNEVFAPSNVAASPGFVEEYAKNASAMMNLLSSFQQRQESQLAQFSVPLERIQRLYYQSDQDRKNFINQLDSRFKSVLGDVSFQQRMVIYGFGTGLLLLGFIVWGFLVIVGRMRSKREEIVMKYQQEMLKMVRDMAALPGGGYAALPGVSAAGMGMRLPGPSAPIPQFAPQAVNPQPINTETINADSVVADPSLDPIEQLEEITRTGNIKERAIAAMKMLNLDAERGVEIIQRILSDQDPFQRECMAVALGEQYHPLILELMLQGLRDPERRVAVAAGRAYKRWEEMPEDICPATAREQIRVVLKQKKV